MPITATSQPRCCATAQLVAALEEERFARIKHVAGFPARAIARGLAMAGATPARRRHLGHRARPPRAPAAEGVVRADPSARRARCSVSTATPPARARSIPEVIAETFGLAPEAHRARRDYVEHHPAHLASAFLHQRHERMPRAARSTASAISSASRSAHGRGGRLDGDRSRVLSALARPALPRDHAVSRLQEIRRRIQGDGPGAVRDTVARRTRFRSS